MLFLFLNDKSAIEVRCRIGADQVTTVPPSGLKAILEDDGHTLIISQEGQFLIARLTSPSGKTREVRYEFQVGGLVLKPLGPCPQNAREWAATEAA